MGIYTGVKILEIALEYSREKKKKNKIQLLDSKFASYIYGLLEPFCP